MLSGMACIFLTFPPVLRSVTFVTLKARGLNFCLIQLVSFFLSQYRFHLFEQFSAELTEATKVYRLKLC